MTKGGSSVSGDRNMVAGRDIYLNENDSEKELSTEINPFVKIDSRFRETVNSVCILRRAGGNVVFSSEGLFTSLVRINLNYEDALEATSRVVSLLADQRDLTDDENWIPSTLDVRSAVMRVFTGFADDAKHSREQVSFWFAAYIRRYGNPTNQYVKVLDRTQYCDLNFEYVKEQILPHVLSRILGLNPLENPLETFEQSVFTGKVRDQMAKLIVEYMNQLNLYTIRYKTLVNLLQDLLLEPPHPWLVNLATSKRVTDYNIERAQAHFMNLTDNAPIYHFEYSARECVQHACAAILAQYCAFLGVGNKYGLIELRRILKIQHQNPELWHFCAIANLPKDLRAIGIDIVMFTRLLQRVTDTFATREQSDRREKLFTACRKIRDIQLKLIANKRVESDA